MFLVAEDPGVQGRVFSTLQFCSLSAHRRSFS